MTTPTDPTAAQGTWQEAAAAGRAADAAYTVADAARAAELAASVERARILAALVGPLAAYDRASEQWQKANAEQDDAPSVKDAYRYSDALENAAHAWAAIARDLVDGNPPAADRIAVRGLTRGEDGILRVADRSAELRVLRAAERNGTRVVYVVNWTPQGVGGFEWRRNREAAERIAHDLRTAPVGSVPDATVQIYAVELPAEVGDDVEGITAWLDSEGWSDGGDPRTRA